MKYLRYNDEIDAILKKPKEEQRALFDAEKLWLCDHCDDVVDAKKNNWDWDMYSQEYCLCPPCREKLEGLIYATKRKPGTFQLALCEEVDGQWVVFKGNRWDYENLQHKLAEKIAKEIEAISGVNKELLGPK